jgi:hypothetical protein
MKIQRSSVFILLALCCALCVLADDPSVEHADAVVTARRQPMIAMSVELRNTSDRPLFVPTCGDLEGVAYLCTLAVNVETYRNHRWRLARTCRDCSLVGGVVPKTGITIPSRGTAELECLLADDIYNIAKGQQTRLVIHAWKDAASMTAGDPPLDRITSRGFAFP